MKNFMQTLRNMFAPKFHVSPRVFRLLEDIARVREGLRLSLIKVPWVPSLVRDAMARAAWGSTAMEGCTLCVEDVQTRRWYMTEAEI